MAEQGDKNEEISDDAKKFDALADMIRDACSKMDAVGTRMDAIEDSQRRLDARKDEDEDKEEERKDSDEDEDKDEKSKADSDEDDKKEEERKDADEKEEAEADHAPISRAEAAAIRAEIASMSARAPAILSDADRERFAVIQEQAEPAFQAFGDRAPMAMQGETPTQYKRRLASKLQSHSPKWKDSRLSAIADDAMLDTVIGDIYADSLEAARRGVAVPAGQLRARERSSGGHTIIEYEGAPDWMTSFAGNSQRATGDWRRPH